MPQERYTYIRHALVRPDGSLHLTRDEVDIFRVGTLDATGVIRDHLAEASCPTCSLTPFFASWTSAPGAAKEVEYMRELASMTHASSVWVADDSSGSWVVLELSDGYRKELNDDE